MLKEMVKKTAKKDKPPNAPFVKAMKPSEVLAKIVGNDPHPRTEIHKKLWEI